MGPSLASVLAICCPVAQHSDMREHDHVLNDEMPGTGLMQDAAAPASLQHVAAEPAAGAAASAAAAPVVEAAAAASAMACRADLQEG